MNTTLVTSKQVRDWAITQGLMTSNRGIVAQHVIDAYEQANPGHLHSRYAHGPGGYDKGCRCDECKVAHGTDPNYCPTCTRRQMSVTTAHAEVIRLARAMSRSPRSEGRLRPALDAAKAKVQEAKENQARHASEHRDAS
jgi:hypothetical protein